MTYDGIIFDIDGTLWNACQSSAIGINQGLKELGVSTEFTKFDIESFSGQPFAKGLQGLLPNLELTPEVIDLLNKSEQQAIKDLKGDFYLGFPELFIQLSKSHKLYLISNCQDWYLDLFIQTANIQNYITDSDCHGKSSKTKAEMLKEMTIKHHIKNPVYIGDTLGDQIACKEANVDFIWASYGFGKDLLLNKKTEKKLEEFKQLLEFLS
jgi:phosphoglycolate phosphatase